MRLAPALPTDCENVNWTETL